MRRFIWASKPYVTTDGLEIIYNFMLFFLSKPAPKAIAQYYM